MEEDRQGESRVSAFESVRFHPAGACMVPAPDVAGITTWLLTEKEKPKLLDCLCYIRMLRCVFSKAYVAELGNALFTSKL